MGKDWDKPTGERHDLRGAEALLFFHVPRRHRAKLEVSPHPPPADSGVEGVTAGGREAGCSLCYRSDHLM